jgi:hypothetical protein
MMSLQPQMLDRAEFLSPSERGSAFQDRLASAAARCVGSLARAPAAKVGTGLAISRRSKYLILEQIIAAQVIPLERRLL